MKKIFISMPTKGKSPEKINDDNQFLTRAATTYIREPVELIESYISSLNDNNDLSPIEILAENIKRMSEADYIVFGEGFSENRECRTIYDVAQRYYKTILFEKGNKLKGVS